MRNDALYAYLPRWMVESPLPTALERDVGAGAWSVYRAIVEEETARNVLPGRVDIDLDDLALHSGLNADRARTLVGLLEAHGYITAQPTADGAGWYFTVAAPPPLPIDREALIAQLRARKYAARGISLRYLDDERVRSRWRELLDQYHAVFGGKISAAIAEDLRTLGEQFDAMALREAFQEARDEGAKSLAWIVTRLHRRADRDYIPNVGTNFEGNPDDVVWRADSQA